MMQKHRTIKNQRITKYSGMWYLILIGVIIFSIFFVVMVITKIIIIPYNQEIVPIGKVQNQQIFQNIYLNPVDTFLFQSKQTFKEQAYLHPNFYNPISITHKLGCLTVKSKLLNLKAICVWTLSQSTIDANNAPCILYYNSNSNKLLCR